MNKATSGSAPYGRRATHAGFTIIELLIVIVVIAILAAISVVAYSGIQSRAENQKTIQAISVYGKAILGYAAINGKYPTDLMGGSYPCLGNWHCGKIITGSEPCAGPAYYDGTGFLNTGLETLLNQVVDGPLPKLSSQIVHCGDNGYRNGYYHPTDSNGTGAFLVFYLKGDQACSNIVGGVTVGSEFRSATMTRCQLNFPSLTP